MGRASRRKRGDADVQRRPRRPAPAHLNLLSYIKQHWGFSTREARKQLLGGKVNVNGSVWAYPEVPLDRVGFDECGRFRIMVEGQPDPRPCAPSGQARVFDLGQRREASTTRKEAA